MLAVLYRCDLHNVKYFRGLNGLLGKMGSSPNIQLTLWLISSFCTPVLFYGLDAMRLTKAQLNSLTFPYNSAFMKLFSTYDLKIITQCQFYSGYLPLKFLLDLKCLNFYLLLGESCVSPASILFHWFGRAERDTVASEYEISDCNNSLSFVSLIWTAFEKHCKALG